MNEIEKKLRNNFPFEPTPSQSRMLYVLSRFILSERPQCLLMIKGYAGTGKTTTVNGLVNTLEETQRKYVLLAPTGRAAKVLSNYTDRRALTIHKKIYFQQRSETGGMHFVPGLNKHTHTVFVVDEASMIGWENYSPSGHTNLLEDLFTYVYGGKDCKLILIGDGAQLPPVGSDFSPALDPDFLRSRFTVTAALGELTDVTRQKEDSGILVLATAIRKALFSKEPVAALPFIAPAQSDVTGISGNELQEFLEDAFVREGPEGTMLITRSNKRANLFNKQIRARVFYREEEIEGGDLIMAVKNNYRWLDADSKAGFIANGDVMEVIRLGKHEEVFGFRFVHATVRLIDYPEEPEVETVLWLDTLDIEAPAMPQKAVVKLYNATLETYADLPRKSDRKKAVNDDPYYNALQVKFAYSVTCHKAQGGQWPFVFVDQGYLTDDMMDREYLRWLYTAVTRATRKLFLLNFSDRLIDFEEE